MNHFISDIWVDAIGWTLIHALWQCTLVAAILWIALTFMRKVSAQWQYLTALIGLVSSVLWVSIGLFQQYQIAVTPEVSPILSHLDQTVSTTVILDHSGTSNNYLESLWLSIQTKMRVYLPWLFYTWLIGIVFLGIRLLGGLGYVNYLVNNAMRPIQKEWSELIDQLRERMGISQNVLLKVSHQIGEPLAVGYIKPVILFPLGLLSGLSLAQIEAILIHELAHIRRADYWVNLFQNLVETILFFHPAIWWISSQVRKTREDCCDDWVIEMGSDPSIYASALLDIHSFNQLPKTHLAMSATGKTGHLTQRIHRLFATSVTQTNAFQRSAWAMILLCLGALSVAFNLHLPVNNDLNHAKNVSTHEVGKVNSTPLPETPILEKVDLSNEINSIKKAKNEILINPITKNAGFKIASRTIAELSSRLDSPVKKIIIKGNSPEEDVVIGMEKKPLYILDGEKLNREVTIEELDLNPEDIESIDVLKGNSAMEAYGEDAKNGVVRIWTKEGAKRKTKPEVEQHVKIRPNNHKNPLYVIDGVMLDQSTSEEELELDPNEIESINVLKGESAIETYGEKGKNGVIQITTKKGAKKKTKTKEKVKPENAEAIKVVPEDEVEIRIEEPGHVLYFIDGVPAEALGIDPHNLEVEIPVDDIESMEVLKGEYLKSQGIEGADKAVYIHTKSGKYAAKMGKQKPLKALSMNVYPNPSDDLVNVEITSQKDTQIKVLVMNAQGQLVAKLMDGNMRANEQTKLRWSAQNQPVGTYYVYVIRDGKAVSKAIQIQ